MVNDHTVRVRFIDGSERIVPAKDIRNVGEEGARRATALVDDREVPIYNRVEWGFLWHEQAVGPHSPESPNYDVFDDDL